MRLWRLSGKQHAQSFDGGYGLFFDGRWNRAGFPITYCATSPALCLLEKLVHVEDPALMPELMMVVYEAPDSLGAETLTPDDLPPDWVRQETLTQQRGDAWLRARTTPLMRVPSAIVPLRDSPDVNVLINHAHPAAAQIRVARAEPFLFDPRLF